MLLAAAQWTFVDAVDRYQTGLQKKSFDAIKWLYNRCNEVEDDRNNAVHAPLWKSAITGQVHPRSAFGNIRAKNLDNKFLIPEYHRLRDTTLLLRNYAVQIHDPMSNERLAWPDIPKLPDRGATKMPPPHPPSPPEEHLLLLKS
jgi:hypothetical protein